MKRKRKKKKNRKLKLEKQRWIESKEHFKLTGMQHRTVWFLYSNVSKEPKAFNFREIYAYIWFLRNAGEYLPDYMVLRAIRRQF